MRHLFLINPAAGKKTDPQRLYPRIHQVMDRRGEDFEVHLTTYHRHAEQIAREAAMQTREHLRIYAFGGDGTLNEVVNGAAGFDHVAITVSPSGSGNDFLKLFGPGQKRFADLAALVDGEEAVFDLIECNGRLSINIASVGLDARVGVGMSSFKRLPLVSGNMAYLLSLVASVSRGIWDHYWIDLDGERLEGDYTLMAACNGRYYGGSFCPIPSAMPDDGVLDFALVKKVSPLKIAQLVGKYAAGEGKNYPDLIRIHRGQSMTVRCKRAMVAQTDGEKLVSDSLSFRLSAKKIRFIYPKGVSWTPK